MHHIELYVSDLEASKQFWGWFLGELGYEPFQTWDSGISWKKDDFYLVFVQTEERFLEQGFHRRRIGLNHLAFHAESREQVDMMTEKLLERGYHVLYRDRHPYAGGAHYAVYAEDPDRIKVELVAPSL
ncbi:VOC family protein [Bacillus atrophaeus]|uniref:VOC family protein n=1 Tax=Bacillus atrophaeus TaxID=1452 RepID=UPI002DB70BCB|nr:VOC family protein [Bacillus atrophaeus]MEC1903024.1 VOC family protein [Bacillus atrophaeus]MEC2399007.1 VOC family protein [Bacillus atrophaeus]MED4435575.1 VOC family protein [Bacillus atrophaeus]MED4567721.1 VOC family protein [Bacillus atrophaeus]MED4574217.1 VOC family protein [Bacillus atrophaeus]